MGRSELPEEVVDDILSRLPVKSLKRFSCLNKSWYTRFQNSCFITKHHHHSSQKNPSILVCGLESRKRALSLHPAKLDDDNFDSGIILDTPFFPGEDIKLQCIMGACGNGVICMQACTRGDHFFSFVLWNPAIREFKVVPALPVQFPSNIDYQHTASGFGYDHNSNDFKVVTILTYWKFTGYSLIWDPRVILYKQVEVYTLSTDSWRQVNCDTISDIHVFGGCCEIYLNGAYHWSGRTKEKDYNIIVSFDMSNEVFGTLSMPDLTDTSHFNQIWQALAVLGNCVALIVYNICAPEKIFDIWVVHEYGVKESWTKQYVIGPLSGIRKLVGPANSGHILLLGDKILLVEDKGQVVVYNLNAQQIKNLQVTGHPLYYATQAMAYVESLVSIIG